MNERFTPLHWFVAFIIVGILSFFVGYFWPRPAIAPQTYSVGPKESPAESIPPDFSLDGGIQLLY